MSPPRSLRGHLLAALGVAVLAHLGTVWAIPRVIMDRIITLGSSDSSLPRLHGVTLPPPTDHTQRRIVMPSPDLLYATCFFDLSERPMRVSFATDYPRYWSIALYASTSDNFYVVNDREATEGRVDIRIVREGSAEQPNTVVSPTDRGMLLMRLLVNEDPNVLAAAEAARRQLRCQTE